MTNETLDKLTTMFMGFQHLETVSLVGNVKLGFSSARPLKNFIAEVGRRCKVRRSPLCLGPRILIASGDLLET